MLWLVRGMAGLPTREFEADRARLGALGPEPMPDRLFGVLRHERLELGLGALMLGVRGPGPGEDHGVFRPGIGRAHVDHPHGGQPWAGRLDVKEARGLA